MQNVGRNSAFKKEYYMAGKCKFCGFVSSDEGMVAHASSCPAIDGQPDTMEETLHIAQQAQPKITPHCGVCFWFPSATCEKCTEYSHFVEDPA